MKMKKILAASAAILLLCLSFACAENAQVPASITRESARAFASKPDMRTLVIPEGVRVIEQYAFAETGLELVTLPASLEEMAGDAFDLNVQFIVYYGSKAQKLVDPYHIYKVISKDAPYDIEFEIEDHDGTAKAVITGYIGTDDEPYLPDEIEGALVYRIGPEAFRNSGIKSVRLPSSVEIIDDAAFSDCGLLASVAFSNGLNEIGAGAFENCTSLSNVALPDTLTAINNHAFAGCSQLTEITIPESVTSMGDWAFGGCSSLGKVVLPESVQGITNTVFKNCTALKEVTMSVDQEYTATVFDGCENVEVIHYTAGNGKKYNKQAGSSSYCLEYVSRRALKVLDFGEGITDIGDQAFDDKNTESPELCFVLETVRLPSTLKTIGYAAFRGLTYLTEVNLPDGLQSIDNEAFANCSSLIPPSIPGSVTYLGNDIFAGCKEPE